MVKFILLNEMGSGETNSTVEDVNTICPIVVEGFIYDIPGIALPLIMCDLVGDVVLQSSNEGCICPSSRGYLKLSGL
jgi:hypothetical protein